jgi:hypothetical protein
LYFFGKGSETNQKNNAFSFCVGEIIGTQFFVLLLAHLTFSGKKDIKGPSIQ